MSRIGYKPKFQAFDSNGDPLTGGKLYTYAEGTTTNKATYSDVGLTTPNANPIVLDSRGEATIFLSGNYKFVLKTAADVTIWTIDNIRGSEFHEVANAGTDLAAAITAAGATNTTILVDKTQTLAAHLTIPANVELWFARGGKVTLGNYNLTINGSLQAESFQIFSCTGTGVVVFGATTSVDTLYPRWWGATGDGTTDDTAAIQACLTAAPARSTVCFTPGTYKLVKVGSHTVSTILDLWGAFTTTFYSVLLQTKSDLHIKGVPGAYITVSRAETEKPNAFTLAGCTNVMIENLEFQGTGVPTTQRLCTGAAVLLDDCDNVVVRNNVFKDMIHGVNILNQSRACVAENNLSYFSVSTYYDHLGSHFQVAESHRNIIRNNRIYGAESDGLINVMGCHGAYENVVEGNQLVGYLMSDEATKTIYFTSATGINNDGICIRTRITDNYVYGMSTGIATKNYAHQTLISNNQVVKCEAGILVYPGVEGLANPDAFDHIVSNNYINPNDGNGLNQAMPWATGLTQVNDPIGIMIQAHLGVLCDGNTIENTSDVASANQNFYGILVFHEIDMDVHKEGLGVTISNNRINLYNYRYDMAVYSYRNAILVRVLAGEALRNLNITGNQIRPYYSVGDVSATSTIYIYGPCYNLSITNNTFGPLRPDPFIYINGGTSGAYTRDVLISGNNFGLNGGVMAILNAGNVNVSNNVSAVHLHNAGAGVGAEDTFYFYQVDSLTFTGNSHGQVGDTSGETRLIFGEGTQAGWLVANNKLVGGNCIQSNWLSTTATACLVRDNLIYIANAATGWLYQGSVVWDPGSIADGDNATTTLTVYMGGATANLKVDVFPPYTLAGLGCTGYVSAANTVTIMLWNNTGGAVDLGSGTWKVQVHKAF